jgi:hypothetical protein
MEQTIFSNERWTFSIKYMVKDYQRVSPTRSEKGFKASSINNILQI